MPDLAKVKKQIEEMIKNKLEFGNAGRVVVESLEVGDSAVHFDIVLHYAQDASMFSIPNQGIVHVTGNFDSDDPASYNGRQICVELPPEFEEDEFCLHVEEIAELFTTARV